MNFGKFAFAYSYTKWVLYHLYKVTVRPPINTQTNSVMNEPQNSSEFATLKDLYCLLVQIDFLLYMFKWLILEITANAIGNNLGILCACILKAGTWRMVWTPTVYRTTLHSLLTLVCQEEFPCQCKPGTPCQDHLLLPHPPWLCRIEIIMKNIQTTAYIETRVCPLSPAYNVSSFKAR